MCNKSEQKNHTFQKETVHGQVNWTLLLLHRGKFSKGVYLVAARLKLWLRSTIKSLFFFTYLRLAHKICYLESTIFKIQLIRPPKLVANNFCGAFRNCTQHLLLLLCCSSGRSSRAISPIRRVSTRTTQEGRRVGNQPPSRSGQKTEPRVESIFKRITKKEITCGKCRVSSHIRIICAITLSLGFIS